MPRKVDPHLNERTDELPTDRAREFTLPDATLELISEHMPDEMPDGLVDEITYAFAEYEWEQKAGEHRYTRAEAAKALRDLIARAEIDIAAVRGLNERAFHYLYLSANRKTQDWMLSGQDAPALAEDIHQAAGRVLDMLSDWRGPEYNIPVYVLVHRLCEAYEAATDNLITLSNKSRDRGYSQEAQSPGGKFVSETVRSVDFDILPSTVSNQIKGYVRQRGNTAGQGTNPSDL